MSLIHIEYFFKLYFILYTITVVLIFPPLTPSAQHPSLPQAIPPPLFMSMGHVYNFFGYSISYTVLYIPMAILYLFELLNPLTSSCITQHLPPIWQLSKHSCIHDSVSVLLVCLVCFLDSIVDKRVLISMLLL